MLITTVVGWPNSLQVPVGDLNAGEALIRPKLSPAQMKPGSSGL